MKRIGSTLIVLTLCCLFTGISLFAQQATATVNHGVSLRGDPSTKNPPIRHLNRNTTVTLLAKKPRAGEATRPPIGVNVPGIRSRWPVFN